MKQLTYNQSNAASILMAVLFLGKYPSAEVKTTEAKGTDFKSKLDAEEIKPGYVLSLLLDEEESFLKDRVALGIESNYYDINDFKTQMTLKKLIEGNKDIMNRIANEGRIVSGFIKSPSSYTLHDKITAERFEAETAANAADAPEGPVTDVDKPEVAPSESSDVKE